MRIQGLLILAVTAGCIQAAAAGSIVTVSPSTSAPSVMRIPQRDGSNSVVAPAATVATPSMVVMPGQAPADMPSIIVIGKPSASTARVVDDAPPVATDDGEAEIIRVVRGGEAGGPYPPPEPEATDPLTQPGVPMLDPNDRGTPAKRNALRKQEERLAREAAAAEQQNAAPPASQTTSDQ